MSVYDEIKTGLTEAIEYEKGETKAKETKIVIKKTKDGVTLTSLFENHFENYTPENIDWGEPVGKEIQ